MLCTPLPCSVDKLTSAAYARMRRTPLGGGRTGERVSPAHHNTYLPDGRLQQSTLLRPRAPARAPFAANRSNSGATTAASVFARTEIDRPSQACRDVSVLILASLDQLLTYDPIAVRRGSPRTGTLAARTGTGTAGGIARRERNSWWAGYGWMVPTFNGRPAAHPGTVTRWSVLIGQAARP